MAIFNGTGGNDTLTGTAAADQIFGFGGNDTIDGGAGADQMDGGTGNDYYTVDNASDIVVEAAGGGNDDGISSALTYYVLPANVENLDFWAAANGANLHGVGNALDNWITGRSGNDILDGGAGADTLHGGLGDDTYYFDNVGDWTDEEGDEGYDTIYTTVVPAAFLQSAVERLIYTGAANVNITGGWRNNDITTGAGNDVIDGGAGGDVMRGGKGDDIYYTDSAGDVVVEQANEGTDTIRTTLAEASMNGHVENMVYIGTGDFFGFGNALANRIEGGAGYDTLYGLEGNDTLIGFGGDDRYWAEDSGDMIVEAVGGGWDRVWVTAASYTLPANVEDLTVYTDIGVHAVGNALNNTLSGRDGNDILNGAGGADMMFGGKGDDVYFVDHANDYVQEADNQGFDTVNYYLGGSYMLRAGFEKLVYLGGSAPFMANGNALENVIIAGAGSDWLNGWGGADTMEGKAGNDTYYVDDDGDKVIEAAGEGTDSVHVAIDRYVLPANVENLYREGSTSPFNGTGNALNNRIEGSFGHDVLDGGAGADILVGSSGNDVYVLDNAGDQTVEYGGGGIDEIRTALGSRTDFNQMFVLPENIENLTGTSATGQGVYANALDNVVSMGAGADLIVMHDGGHDRVNAGGGDDFVHYGAAFDAYDVNDGGAGFDTLGLLGTYSHVFSDGNLTNFEKLALYSSGGGGAAPNHYDLIMSDANVGASRNLMVVAQSLLTNETLMFDGSAETNGTFNIRAGRGDDRVQGGEGADQIWGNLGADILAGSGGNDMFEYFAAEESTVADRDTILDFTAGDKINLKNIDADGNAANGNSKFVFLGEAWFNGKAGEVRTVQTAEGWLVEADIDGDSFADLSIAIINSSGHIPAASDFWL